MPQINARIWLSPVLLLGTLALLPGCSGGDVSRTFGLVRDAPDEFAVTTRAPLSMPPDYALRAPRPGATRPQELSSRKAAEATLAPGAALSTSSGQMSPGQSALLEAGGRPAAADIRDKVDSEASAERTDRSFADRLLFWRSRPTPGIVVDPAQETQRLRSNSALGQDTLEGDTPIIQPKKKSFFDLLF